MIAKFNQKLKLLFGEGPLCISQHKYAIYVFPFRCKHYHLDKQTLDDEKSGFVFTFRH